MPGAYYGDRPYYHAVVFREAGKWFVRVAGQRYGSGVSRERAIKAAIKFARDAEKQGKTALVIERIGLAGTKQHWPTVTQRAKRR